MERSWDPRGVGIRDTTVLSEVLCSSTGAGSPRFSSDTLNRRCGGGSCRRASGVLARATLTRSFIIFSRFQETRGIRVTSGQPFGAYCLRDFGCGSSGLSLGTSAPPCRGVRPNSGERTRQAAHPGTTCGSSTRSRTDPEAAAGGVEVQPWVQHLGTRVLGDEKHSFRKGGGLVDAPGRRVVGAKREYPLCAAYLLKVAPRPARSPSSQRPYPRGPRPRRTCRLRGDKR
jgi:hypothetical protein